MRRSCRGCPAVVVSDFFAWTSAVPLVTACAALFLPRSRLSQGSNKRTKERTCPRKKRVSGSLASTRQKQSSRKSRKSRGSNCVQSPMSVERQCWIISRKPSWQRRPTHEERPEFARLVGQWTPHHDKAEIELGRNRLEKSGSRLNEE
jgi:hypothetical protein